MNDYLNNCLESGQKCQKYIVDYSAGIPAGSLFETRCAELTTCVDEFEDLAGQAMAAGAEAMEQTDVKSSEREDLIAVMNRNLNAASAAEPDFPGTQDRYYFRRNLSNENLLAAGRSHAQGGTTDGPLLISYGAPAAWVADTTAAADAFEASFATQDSAQISRVALNAQLKAKNDRLGQLKRTVGFFVKLYFENDIGAQTAWKSAAHVKRP